MTDRAPPTQLPRENDSGSDLQLMSFAQLLARQAAREALAEQQNDPTEKGDDHAP